MSQFEADYYDIEAILAEEEATPCVFKSDVHKLGYLDSGSVEEDVRVAARARAPRAQLSGRADRRCTPVSKSNCRCGSRACWPPPTSSAPRSRA